MPGWTGGAFKDGTHEAIDLRPTVDTSETRDDRPSRQQPLQRSFCRRRFHVGFRADYRREQPHPPRRRPAAAAKGSGGGGDKRGGSDCLDSANGIDDADRVDGSRRRPSKAIESVLAPPTARRGVVVVGVMSVAECLPTGWSVADLLAESSWGQCRRRRARGPRGSSSVGCTRCRRTGTAAAAASAAAASPMALATPAGLGRARGHRARHWRDRRGPRGSGRQHIERCRRRWWHAHPPMRAGAHERSRAPARQQLRPPSPCRS